MLEGHDLLRGAALAVFLLGHEAGCELRAPLPPIEERAPAPGGCLPSSDISADAGPPPRSTSQLSADTTPSAGAALTLMTWNLEWFGDTSEGPTDETTQYDAVRNVLAERGTDIVALQEVASEDAFDRLLGDLPGYASALSGYAWTQRTALLWDRSLLELVHARALSGLDDAGRPPLIVTLRRKRDDFTLRVIVVHAKAQADAASHDKRAQLALGLKTFIDLAPELPTIIAGDFNDLLRGSITSGADTPYRAFLEDPRFVAPTLSLDAPGAAESSYAHGRGTIDHVLLAPSASFEVDPGSVNVLQNELLAEDPTFSATVSDHFPVVLALGF